MDVTPTLQNHLRWFVYIGHLSNEIEWQNTSWQGVIELTNRFSLVYLYILWYVTPGIIYYQRIIQQSLENGSVQRKNGECKIRSAVIKLGFYAQYSHEKKSQTNTEKRCFPQKGYNWFRAQAPQRFWNFLCVYKWLD